MSIFEVIWLACCMIALLFFAIYEVIMDHRRFVIDVDGVLYEYVRVDFSMFTNEITIFDERTRYQYRIKYNRLVILEDCWKHKVPLQTVDSEDVNEE